MPKLPPILRDLFNTHGEITPVEQAPPLFITGAMRSGTTFLVNQLAAHPQLLKIGAELNNVWTTIGGASMLGACVYRDETHASPVYTYQMTRYFSEYIHLSKSPKRHLMRLAKWNDTNLFRVNYDWDALIPVNKSPHMMNKTRYVHGLFPESKLVVIVRDIYAQSASLKHHFMQNNRVKVMPSDPQACWSIYEPEQTPSGEEGHNFKEDFSTIPLMWLRLNAMVLADIQKIPREKVFVLKYEDLIMDTEQVFDRLYGFLALKEEHRGKFMQRIQQGARSRNTTTKGDPLTKWKKTMSADEIAQIDQAIASNQAIFDAIQDGLKAYANR